MKELTKTTLLAVLFITLFPWLSYPQERAIKGVVISSDSIPLICAEVSTKGSKQTVLTDSMGNFQIVCTPKDKIKINAEGFIPMNVKFDEVGNDPVFVLNYDSSDMDTKEVNRLIYDEENEKGVAYINGKPMDILAYRDIFDFFENRLPGVEVVDNGDSKAFIIRGASFMNQDNYALILLDGIIVEQTMVMDFLKALSPLDIKSVDIIKDGVSSMYGSRGANGVIKIRTKTGRNN